MIENIKTTGNRANQYQYRHDFRSDKSLRDELMSHCQEIGMSKAEFIRKAIKEKLRRDKKRGFAVKTLEKLNEKHK